MNIPSMGEIIPMLAETHRVYAQEFQGHGRTTVIDRPITYPNLAGDVAAFMDAVGVEKADMDQPLPESRLAVMPATSHTAVINQPALLHAFIEPFLQGTTPKGLFE